MATLLRRAGALAAVLGSAAAASRVSSPDLVTVWTTDYSPGAYPHCFRQPVLLVLDDQNLIAFAEGRNNTWCSGTNDGFPSSIHVKSSSNGGASWSSEQVLFTGGVDYLGGLVDASTRVAHFFVQQGGTVLYTRSADAGASWTPLGPLPHLAGPTGYTPIPAVGAGIQLVGDLCSEPTCGGLVGRLVMPFVCNAKKTTLHAGPEGAQLPPLGGDTACPGCYSCLAVSDDHGASWSIAADAVSTQEGSREASVAQVLPSAWGAKVAAVYASERNLGNDTGYRLHAVSTDGGSSLSLFGGDKGLPDSKVTNWTGIVAGLTRFDGPPPGAQAPTLRRLVFATPMSTTARADMALFTSTDEGRSWGAGSLYRAGPAGYSCVAALNATHGGLLFENGDDEFAQRISFGLFTAADL